MTFRRHGHGLRGGTALLGVLALLALAGCGGGSSGSSGTDPAAPSISGSPVTQAQVGKAYAFTPTVKNSSGRAVSFSIENKPAWASFSISTGQLTGTPTAANVGSYANVVISASNGSSTSSLAPFTITVGAGGAGTATLSWSAPTTNTDGTALTDLGGYTIDYGTSATALNESVTIPSASTTSYTIENLSAGTWYFSIVAYTTDGSQSPQSNVVSTTVD
jgi:Putative Ig domain